MMRTPHTMINRLGAGIGNALTAFGVLGLLDYAYTSARAAVHPIYAAAPPISAETVQAWVPILTAIGPIVGGLILRATAARDERLRNSVQAGIEVIGEKFDRHVAKADARHADLVNRVETVADTVAVLKAKADAEDSKPCQ